MIILPEWMTEVINSVDITKLPRQTKDTSYACHFAVGDMSFLSGLMADTFGNYIVAFIVAGGVGVIGSLLPFILLCLKHEAGRHEKNTWEDA